jgi:Flp pilus assembly protein TadG
MNMASADRPHRRASFLAQEGGNVAIMTALSLTVLLGVAGAAIDFVNTSDRQVALQAAVDAAALAGVREDGSDNKRIAAAQASYKANTRDFTFKISAATFQFEKGSTKLFGSANFESSNAFTSVLGIGARDLPVTATAVYEAAPSTPAFCIHSLSPSAGPALIFNNKRGPLTYTGFGTDAPECSVQVNSSSSSAVQVKEATGYRSLKSCIVGGVSGSSASLTPSPDGSCKKSMPDPFAAMTAPAASGSCASKSATSLKPGRYCGGLNLSGSKLSFEPGVYVIEGGSLTLNASAGIDANGVTFVMAPGAGAISIQSAGLMNLTAPSSGPTANFLVIDRTGKSVNHLIKSTVRDASWMSLNGVIYTPEDNMQLFWQRGGVGASEKPLSWTNFGLIANTIDMHGYNQLFIAPSPMLAPGTASSGGSSDLARLIE